MAVCDIQVVPVGTEDPSISSYVKRACQAVEASGLKYDVTATSTVVEGDVEDIFAVIREAHRAPFDQGARRVVTTITIDERADKVMVHEDMVESVTT